MKNNKKWFSIIVAMWLVVLISLLALSILEYIVPFSRNVKWIENSVWSYYMATSAIENALWFVNKNPLWTNSWIIMPTIATWYNYKITALWNILPPPWEWNSEFNKNKNWNRISSGNPIQLQIWKGKITNWNTVKLYIRVPDIDWSPTLLPITESFSWWLAYNVIQWQLSSQSWSLNASWSYITWNDVNDSNLSNKIITFSLKDGIKLDWTPQKIPWFYTNNCLALKSCILKFTVINKLSRYNTPTKKWNLPYLEWKLNWQINNTDNITNTIPLRYTNIAASWKSFGFKKSFKIKVPQNTTIDAFNFTIFQ